MLRTKDETIETVNIRLSQLERLYNCYYHLNDLDQENTSKKLNQINEFYSFLKYYINEINNNNFNPDSLKSDKEVSIILEKAKEFYQNTDFTHMKKMSEMWGMKFSLDFIFNMTEKIITQSTDSITNLVSQRIRKINLSIDELDKLRLYYSQLNLDNVNLIEKFQEIDQLSNILKYHLNDLETYLDELNTNNPLHLLTGELDEQLKNIDEYISNSNKEIINNISNKINNITIEYLVENKSKEYYVNKNDDVYLVKNKNKKIEVEKPINIIFLIKDSIDFFKEKLMPEDHLTTAIIEKTTKYPIETMIKYIKEKEKHNINDDQLIDLENEDKEDVIDFTKPKNPLRKLVTNTLRSKTANNKQKKIEKRTSTLSANSQINPLSENKSEKFVKYVNKLNKYGYDLGYTANIASRTVLEDKNKTSLSYDYNRGKGHKEKTVNVAHDVIVNKNEVKSQLTSDIKKINKLDPNQAKFAAIQWVEDALEKMPKGNKATITLEKYGTLNKDFIKTVVFYCQENGHKINLIPENRQLTQLTEKEKKELRQFFENRKLLTITQPTAANTAPMMKIQHEKKQ